MPRQSSFFVSAFNIILLIGILLIVFNQTLIIIITAQRILIYLDEDPFLSYGSILRNVYLLGCQSVRTTIVTVITKTKEDRAVDEDHPPS